MAEEFDDEFDGPVKRFLFVNRKAPYGTVYALESLEVVLISAAFDQDVSLVFMDDGVFQIVKDQNTDGINIKNFSRTYRALEGYDVEKLYVEKESLEARGLSEDDLLVPVEVLDSKALSELMNAQDVVISA
ncbi:MAG: sulfurtransferase complex subunit TusC [Proteobacteria bacterium]|nr:sulfurtransferase complex subunit TusC [Pseudomonadota bacterium]